jgi:outer membrane biosynthesis protein TonB
MVFANLRREERIGLGIALALHVALAVALLLQPASRKAPPPVERMTVNLATDVGLEATAPEPVPESAAAIAPTLAPEPAPPAQAQPAPAPPIERPMPVATTPPKPKPVPRATTAPRPKPTQSSSEPRRRPDAPASQTHSSPKPKPAGGSRIGADFLPGAGSSATTRETRVPASQIGASAKASLVQAIVRQLRPHWKPPSGPDVEKISTYLRFRLNEDGSLAGRPEFVRQTGVNDTNRAQADRHKELAIRAVQLAAPFDLPSEYYNAWKLVGPFEFNLDLAQ